MSRNMGRVENAENVSSGSEFVTDYLLLLVIRRHIPGVKDRNKTAASS